MNEQDDTPQPTIQVIGRMFALLDVLAGHEQPAALKVLAERTGLHPSTAHRILNDLAWGGLVERSSAGHYALGPKFIALGNLSRTRLDLVRAATPLMKQLQVAVGRPVGLFVWKDERLVCLHAIAAAASSPFVQADMRSDTAMAQTLRQQAQPGPLLPLMVDPLDEAESRVGICVLDDRAIPSAALALAWPMRDPGLPPEAEMALRSAASTLSSALGRWDPVR